MSAAKAPVVTVKADIFPGRKELLAYRKPLGGIRRVPDEHPKSEYSITKLRSSRTALFNRVIRPSSHWAAAVLDHTMARELNRQGTTNPFVLLSLSAGGIDLLGIDSQFLESVLRLTGIELAVAGQA